MKQATPVALYGDKLSPLVDLISEIQSTVAKSCRGAFEPYDVRQIHATIIGLEHRIGSLKQNLNFWKYRGRQVETDLDGFLTFLKGSSRIPFAMQVAGFADRHYPFLSDPFEKRMSARPYDRSFSIQGDKVVVMGWPIRGAPMSRRPRVQHEFAQEAKLYPQTLDDIRRAAQKFGLGVGLELTVQ